MRQKDSSRKAPCFLGWQLPWGDEERTDPPGEALGASVKPSPVPPLTPIPRPGPQPPPSPRSAAFPPPAQPPGAAALDLDDLSLLSLCLMLWPERPEDVRPPDRPPCPGLAPPEESAMTETLIRAAETSPSPRGLSRHGPWAGGPRMTPPGLPFSVWVISPPPWTQRIFVDFVIFLCASCKTLVENLLKLYVFGAQSLHTYHKNACWCR